MDGYGVVLLLIALFVGIWSHLDLGRYKRYDFNYKLGQAMERGQTGYSERKIYRRVLLRCLSIPVFGWLYLIGWWLAGDYGLKEGRESIGEMDKPKRLEGADTG